MKEAELSRLRTLFANGVKNISKSPSKIAVEVGINNDRISGSSFNSWAAATSTYSFENNQETYEEIYGITYEQGRQLLQGINENIHTTS